MSPIWREIEKRYWALSSINMTLAAEEEEEEEAAEED